MAMVYLGLGSNLGACLDNLALAATHLQQKIELKASSSILQTKPLYVVDQPDFYNQVIQGKTDLSPLDLLIFLKNIEGEVGRTPTYLYGPRIIDIDILYYDRLIFNTPQLQIPHPKNHERPFVLSLMLELNPAFICPLTNQPLGEMLTKLT